MSLFSNMKTDGLEEVQDRVGGYSPLETDIYSGIVKNAFLTIAKSGAQAINLELDFGSQSYREAVYITDSQGKNWFHPKKKGTQERDTTKKVPLPGFVIVDDLCMLTTEKPLSEQDTEEKIVKVYDRDAQAEVNKAVPVLVDLIGKEVSFAIQQSLENKSVKQGNEYVPTAETRSTNNIEKVLHTETKLTVSEAKAGKEAGEYWDLWVSRNKGQVRDKRSIKDGQAGQPGRPSPAGGPPQAGAPGAAAPRKSLFGNKAA